MLEIVGIKMHREAVNMKANALTNDFVQTAMDNTFTEDNITRIVNDNIGPINANNYVGKLNLVILYTIFLFDKNESSELSANIGIEVLENFDNFVEHIFDNWVRFGYYAYQNLFSVFDLDPIIPEIKAMLKEIKEKPPHLISPIESYFNSEEKLIDIERRISSVYEFNSMEQYSPNTPPEVYIYLIHIVSLFSLGVIANGYLNKIMYLGFASKNTYADDILQTPLAFLIHDIIHGSDFLGRTLPTYGEVPVKMWLIRLRNSHNDCQTYVNNDLLQFYRRCERAHGNNPFTGDDFKHSDLYKVQLILFILLHEAIGCYGGGALKINKSWLNRIIKQEESRFMADDDLKGLIPSDVRNDNRKIKEYLEEIQIFFLEKVKNPDKNFLEIAKKKAEERSESHTKTPTKQNVNARRRRGGRKTVRKPRATRQVTKRRG
jgi:hypothetical protein